MLPIIRRVRGALRRMGVDIIPFNQHGCDYVIDAAFARHSIDTVIDVGANRGQFARSLFDYGFAGRVFSFEPLTVAYEDLARAAARHPRWSSYRIALADHDGESIINIGQNDETSSLQPLEHGSLLSLAATKVVGTEPVQLRRLDATMADLGIDPTRAFLKIDVQGSELGVLRGAGSALDAIPLVQIETSLRPIYSGESDFAAMIAHFRDRGFVVRGMRPVYFHPSSLEIMQVDLIVERTGGVG